MNSLSIKLKLILLVVLGLVFVSAVVVIETISNASIKSTNDQNFAFMEQANADYREKAKASQNRIDQIHEVINSVQYARIAEKSYLQFYNPTYVTQLEEHVSYALDMIKKVEKNKAAETLVATLQAYQQDFGNMVALQNQIEGLNNSIISNFNTLKESLSKSEAQIINKRFEMQMQGDELSPIESQFETMVVQAFRTVDFVASMRSQFLLTDNVVYIENLTKHFDTKMGGETASIRQTAKSLREKVYMEAAEKYNEIIYEAYEQTLETRTLFSQQKETTERLNNYGTILTETGNGLLEDIAEQMDTEQKASIATLQAAKEKRIESLARAQKSVRWILVVTLSCGGLISIILAVFIIRSITGPINNVIKGLQGSAHDVASASSQMSTASQNLAKGSSEQAATIEETSSSLEEMSSMTKQNADNAKQADGLMQEANKVVDQANESMAHLTDSINEISKASEETSKIIKTIDEIAFQTNLLALNAAVEAARAGEAGAGFAVVADEVRNLAMRAAEAAKETSNLIKSTDLKVNQGGEIVNNTNDAFVKVAESASKVGELVGEISAASNEQAEGIAQIKRAVVEMDKIVQQNAAGAEESASSSAELNDQADHMKHFVADLVSIATGTAQKKKKSKLMGESHTVKLLTDNEPEVVKPVQIQHVKKLNPEKPLPFDEFENPNDF